VRFDAYRTGVEIDFWVDLFQLRCICANSL